MRRRISEMLLTGVTATALYLTWMLSYSWQLANTGSRRRAAPRSRRGISLSAWSAESRSLPWPS